MTDPDRLTAALDRSLTAATRAKTRGGRGAESTRREYAREWRKYEAWCRPPAVEGRRERWLPVTPCTPLQLAEYARHLCMGGVAPKTVAKALTAIKSQHRVLGLPVPDGVPALGVLREHQDSLDASGVAAKRAEPLPLDDMVRMLYVLDPHTPAGSRDAAALHLLFAGLRVGEASALNLGDLADGDGDLPPITVNVAGRAEPVVLLHWRSTDGVHRSELCSACAQVAWRAVLAGRGVVAADVPFLRQVDAAQHIGGVDAVRMGWDVGDGRLAPKGIRDLLLRALADGGVPGAARYTTQSLRLGGVDTRLAQGGPGLGAFAAGGWSLRSRIVVEYLARFEPATGPVRVLYPPVGGQGQEAGSC